MVLLKGVDERGFVFYTNTGSRKGARAGRQPARARCSSPGTRSSARCASTGTAEPLLRARTVEAYFASPPARLAARRLGLAPVAAWSPGARSSSAAYADAEERFAATRTCRCPTEWGGYRVRPEVVEFWQGRPGRMHDRLRLPARRGRRGWRDASGCAAAERTGEPIRESRL